MLSVFDKYFIGDGIELNWDYVNSIPEFQKLKECQQTPIWHSEGNAYIHVANCVDEAYKIVTEKFEFYTVAHKRRFIMAVLFHDIGKIVTTEFKKGDWHSYGHEIEGEKIARRILWDEDFFSREIVCSLVRWHMERCGIMKCKDVFKKVIQMSYNVDISMLLNVWRCDVYGSKPKDKSSIIENENIIRLVDNIARCNNCYDDAYTLGFINRDDTKYWVFNGGKPWETKSEKPQLIVLIGMAGAGKDTFVNERYRGQENTEILCRDDIRVELGLCKDGEKIVGTNKQEEVVSMLFNKRLEEAAKNGKTIVINNTNLKKKYRDAYKQMVEKHGYQYIYVYIEAPTFSDLVKRRDGQIKASILEDMINRFEYPKADEYDILLTYKQ